MENLQRSSSTVRNAAQKEKEPHALFIQIHARWSSNARPAICDTECLLTLVCNVASRFPATMDEGGTTTDGRISQPSAISDISPERRAGQLNRAPGAAPTSNWGSRACGRTSALNIVKPNARILSFLKIMRRPWKRPPRSPARASRNREPDPAPSRHAMLPNWTKRREQPRFPIVGSVPANIHYLTEFLTLEDVSHVLGKLTYTLTCLQTGARAPLGTGLSDDGSHAIRYRDRQVLGRRRLNVDGPSAGDSPPRQVPRLSSFTPSPIRPLLGSETSNEAEKDAQGVQHGTATAEKSSQRVEDRAEQPSEQRNVQESGQAPSNPPVSFQQPDETSSQPTDADCLALLCLASD
eukprot:4915884-Pleurochrysis_carterae.AAC.1